MDQVSAALSSKLESAVIKSTSTKNAQFKQKHLITIRNANKHSSVYLLKGRLSLNHWAKMMSLLNLLFMLYGKL